jgi:hypothetical protein
VSVRLNGRFESLVALYSLAVSCALLLKIHINIVQLAMGDITIVVLKENGKFHRFV